MRAYALHLQLHFLATRFASMRRMRGTRRKLDARPHLVRGRRDFRARAVRAGTDVARRVDARIAACTPSCCYSPAARPPRLLIYLHGPLDVIRRAHRDARAPEGEGRVRRLLGRVACALRALDRAVPALPCACARRPRLRPRRAIRRDRGHRGASARRSSRGSCRRPSSGRPASKRGASALASQRRLHSAQYSARIF